MSPPNSFDEDMDEYEGEGNYLKNSVRFWWQCSWTHQGHDVLSSILEEFSISKLPKV